MEPVEMIDVPSGRDVWFQETVNERGDGLTFHFRFIAPDIDTVENPDPEETETDMAHLCRGFAVPRISAIGPQPNRIVISLSSEETEFGVANPDVTQFFESYSLENGTCIWEPF